MRTLTSAIVLVFYLACGAVASPLAPFIGASTSPNGQFLVVAERQYDGPEGTVRRIVQTTYRVRRLEPFLNEKDRLDTSARFWTEGWSLSLSGKEGQAAPWPIISNDGKTLVLIYLVWPFPNLPVLSIFREKNYEGEFVKALTISDLWSQDQINPEGTGHFGATDATPLWFAGGTLNFSNDSRELIHRTRWNKTVYINLKDGSVKKR